MYIYIYIYIYPNLPRNAIARMPYPRCVDSLSQTVLRFSTSFF